MPKRRRSRGSDSLQAFLLWADSYNLVSKWFSQYNLEDLLDKNDGLVQLPGFLPAYIAEGALQVIEQISEVWDQA